MSTETNIGIQQANQETIRTAKTQDKDKQRKKTNVSDSCEVDTKEIFGSKIDESTTLCKVSRAKAETQNKSERNVSNEIRKKRR